MAEKLTTEGHVEIWRDYYTDAKLSHEAASALKDQSSQTFKKKYAIPLGKLRTAIKGAPQMAEVAIYRLTSLIMACDMGFPPASESKEASYNNTILALYKYFNIPYTLRSLPKNDPQWVNVIRICSLYDLTLEGLRHPYKIYLYDKPTGEAAGAMGFVRHTKQPGEPPVHEYFRTAPDEHGHIPYPTWLTNTDIHLRMELLTDKKWEKDGVVACLLLHEATHKWANTTDVCYKFQTIAYKNRHNAWQLSDQIKQGHQPSLAREGKAKALMPLAKTGVAVGDWLYNADSYAWAARRLWKQEKKGDDAAQWSAAWED